MARETISQRIALEGGDELKRVFLEIGKTGKLSFEQIKEAANASKAELDKVVSSVERVERSIATLARASAAFGQAAGNFGTAFNAFEGSAGRLVRNLLLLAGGGGLIGAAAAGIVKFGTASARAADDLAENAAAAGVSVEAYQRLQFAAQTAGVKQTQFGTIMGRVSDQFEDARKAQIQFRAALASEKEFSDEEVLKLVKSVAQAGVAFDKLGNDIGNTKNAFLRFGIDVTRLGPEEALLRLGDALKQLPTDTARAQAGFELFGARGGPKFVGFLVGAREALKGFEKEFRAIGQTEQEAKLGGETSDRLDLLALVATKARLKLGAVFDPLVREGADALTQAILRNFGSMEQFAQSIKQRVEPVVRDFIRLLNGDEANIENRWIVEARDGIVRFGDTVANVFRNVVLPTFRALMAAADAVADVINKLFGTNLTGGDIAVIAAIGKITGAFDTLVKAANLAAATVVLFFAALRVPTAVLGALTAIGGAPAVIAAAFAVATIGIVTNWEKIKQAGLDAWEEIKKKWNTPPTESDRLPAGQSGLDLFLTEIRAKAIETWDAIRRQWSQSPVPSLPPDRTAIELLFERAVKAAGSAWEQIKRQWSTSPIPALPSDKLPIELILERLVQKAQTAWNKIKEIWSRNPVDQEQALPEGQSALSRLLSGGNKETQALKEQADAVEALVSGLRALNPEVEKGAAAQDKIAAATQKSAASASEHARATAQTAAESTRATQAKAAEVKVSTSAGAALSEEAQARVAAVAASAKARQEATNLARSVGDSKPIFVEAADSLKLIGTEGAAAAAKARQEQNNLSQSARDAAAAARDLATPFKTLNDETRKLGESTRSLPDLATPMKTLGESAGKAKTETGQVRETIATIGPVVSSVTPKVLEIGKAGQQAGQQAAAGLAPVANSVDEINKAAPKAAPKILEIGQAGQQAGQQAEAGLNPVAGKIAEINQAVTTLGQSGVEFQSTLKPLANTIGTTIDQLQRAGVPTLERINDAFGALEGRAGEATSETQDLGKTSTELNPLQNSLDALGKSLDPFLGKAREAQEAVRLLGQGEASLSDKLRDGGARLSTNVEDRRGEDPGRLDGLLAAARSVASSIQQAISQAISSGIQFGVDGAGASLVGLVTTLQSQHTSIVTAVVSPFTDAVAQVNALLATISAEQPGGLGGAAPAAAGATAGPFSFLVTAAQAAATQIVAIFTALGSQISAALVAGGAVAGAAAGAEGQAVAATGPFDALIQAARTASQQIAQEFSGLGPAIMSAIASGMAGVAQAIQQPLQAIPGFVFNITSQVESAVQQMLQQIERAAQRAIQALEQVIDKANEAAQAASFPGVGAQPFAGGGRVRGPGTSTSDSIFARLSDGEFVIRAAAVRKYGASLFSALNSMRLPGFSFGGLVDRAPLKLPSFAGGGLAVPEGSGFSGRDLGSLTLKTEGGQTFRVFADEEVAEGLSRFAVRANTRLAGRPPSRIGRT